MAKSAAQLLKEEEAKKKKEIVERTKAEIKKTVFFETNRSGKTVTLRFTGDGSSPALNKEYRGSDGPNPEDSIVVPRGGMITVSEEKAAQLEEDYKGEFEKVSASKGGK